jgi:hypothetical protein
MLRVLIEQRTDRNIALTGVLGLRYGLSFSKEILFLIYFNVNMILGWIRKILPYSYKKEINLSRTCPTGLERPTALR